jgi:hypothetical protein
MRRTIPRAKWDRVARSVVFTARKPPGGGGPAAPQKRAAPAPSAEPLDAMPRAAVMRDFGAAGCEEGVLIKIRNLLAQLEAGEILEVRSTDPGVHEDFPAWCRMTGQEYLGAWDGRYFVRRR